jgi:uncharacterized protein (UPF0332 family)
MIEHRLEFAKKYLEDAVELFHQKRFNSAVSRAYYASYQAMWAALGDPRDDKIWRHLAIIKHFVRGYWFVPTHPPSGPGFFEDKRFPLRQLYAYRIQSDYDAIEIDENVTERMLEVVKQTIAMIEEKGGK